jgi:hypothetical protein
MMNVHAAHDIGPLVKNGSVLGSQHRWRFFALALAAGAATIDYSSGVQGFHLNAPVCPQPLGNDKVFQAECFPPLQFVGDSFRARSKPGSARIEYSAIN